MYVCGSTAPHGLRRRSSPLIFLLDPPMHRVVHPPATCGIICGGGRCPWPVAQRNGPQLRKYTTTIARCTCCSFSTTMTRTCSTLAAAGKVCIWVLGPTSLGYNVLLLYLFSAFWNCIYGTVQRQLDAPSAVRRCRALLSRTLQLRRTLGVHS